MSDFVTDNLRGVKYREWKSHSPKAVVLLLHGLGAHSGRWDPFSRFLLERDFSSYAIDLGGFGENAPIKGHVSSFKAYYDDIFVLFDIARQENPESKIYLAGESMGGLIAFMAASIYPDLFSGLICWSPAFVNSMPFNIHQYLNIFSALLYNPKKRIHMPFYPEMYTRDPEMQEHIKTDQKEHDFASSGLLYNILIAQIKSLFAAKNIKVPVLFQVAGTDNLVSPAASEKIFRHISSEDKRIIVYPDMYHSLSVDLDREAVFGDTFKWIKELNEIHSSN